MTRIYESWKLNSQDLLDLIRVAVINTDHEKKNYELEIHSWLEAQRCNPEVCLISMYDLRDEDSVSYQQKNFAILYATTQGCKHIKYYFYT